MSGFGKSEHAGAFLKERTQPWRTFGSRIIEGVWAFWLRRKQRQELLEYIASDYRAAADIGVTSGEARGWSQRPFWRA